MDKISIFTLGEAFSSDCICQPQGEALFASAYPHLEGQDRSHQVLIGKARDLRVDEQMTFVVE
jgi:hypothetical protein